MGVIPDVRWNGVQIVKFSVKVDFYGKYNCVILTGGVRTGDEDFFQNSSFHDIKKKCLFFGFMSL